MWDGVKVQLLDMIKRKEWVGGWVLRSSRLHDNELSILNDHNVVILYSQQQIEPSTHYHGEFSQSELQLIMLQVMRKQT